MTKALYRLLLNHASRNPLSSLILDPNHPTLNGGICSLMSRAFLDGLAHNRSSAPDALVRGRFQPVSSPQCSVPKPQSPPIASRNP